jgi:hypothetical protein
VALSDSDFGKKELVDAASVDKECTSIEEGLQALRAAYEQFFLGMERSPPTKMHDTLKRRLGRIRNAFVRSTAAQFRLAAVTQRMQTYERLWSRTIEQMENGTYRRDVFKAKFRSGPKALTQPKAPKEAAAPIPEAEPDIPDADVEELDDAPVTKASVPKVAIPAIPSVAKVTVPAKVPVTAVPAGARPPVTKGAAKPGAAPARNALNETKLKEVYDAYLMAKKRCNEDTSRLSYDAVASTLKKQVPEILKKHNAKDVDFKVIIKDGKAVLKAVPKE